MRKESKIYIAGHSGMVGSAVIRALERSGYLNILTRERSELDLINTEAVKLFFQIEQPEYVILAAAKVGGIGVNATQPADFLYENLVIQNNVIWQAHLGGVKKLLFLGSSCIYPREAPQPMKEDLFLTGPLEPTNEGYAIAKIAGIELCRFIYRQYGKEFISCMPTNIYGENDNYNEDSSHVIPALLRRFHEAKQRGDLDVTVWGSGSARREFMYVDDLADCIVWLLASYSSEQFINVGTGEDISITELITLITELVGFKGSVRFDTSKPDGSPRKLLDVSRLRAAGWHHSMDIRTGLSKTYDWYVNNITVKRMASVTPLISICIPAYQNVSTLRRLFDSIVIQTFSDYEVVVTDDSRDDSVKDLCSEFADKFPVLIYRKNIDTLGSPRNWNECVLLASGGLVKIMHHDDWFTSLKSLSLFVAYMDRHPQVTFGFCNSKMVWSNGEERVHQPHWFFLWLLRRDGVYAFPYNKIGAPSATIFRRQSFRPFDPELVWVVDIDHYVRMIPIQDQEKFVYIPEDLVAISVGDLTRITAMVSNDTNILLKEWPYVTAKYFDRMPLLARIITFVFFVRLFCKTSCIKAPVEHIKQSSAGAARIISGAHRLAGFIRR